MLTFLFRFSKRFAAAFAFFVFPAFWAAPAAAQDSSGAIFATGKESDLAQLWLKALFRGEPLFASDTAGKAFAEIAAGIQRLLQTYSIGMLTVAGFLLLYYALIAIAQTAQSGKFAWGETNRLWAPLRFALVIALLTPVGGGLGAGQYLILKLAQQGSALASNAWSGATERMPSAFTGLVAPRPPDLRAVTARAFEMSLCRAIYKSLYALYQTDEAVRRVGDIADLDRAAANRLSGETWSYANNLHADPPLCGAYRFAASNASNEGSAQDKAFAALMQAARASTEKLAVQADAFAARYAPRFALSGADSLGQDGASSFAGFLKDQQEQLDARLRSLASAKLQSETQALSASQESGWVMAGGLLFDLMNRQASLASMADRAVPSVDPPLLGHRILEFNRLVADVQNKLFLHAPVASFADKLFFLYDRANAAMSKARAWLYGSQIVDADLVPATSLDLDDVLVPGADSEKGFAALRRLLDAGLASFGVWGRAPQDQPRLSSLTLSNEMKERPLSALGEMGRRYAAMGSWLMGLAGQGLATPATLVPAAVFVLVGGLIALSGIGLLFFVPVLPFLRFLAAVLTWLVLVFEALASVPLVAIAHMNPNGEGLASDTAKRAYGLWLSVFLRPFLTVFGFLVGWAGFFLGLLLLNALFASIASSFVLVRIDTLTGARVAIALLYALAAVIVSNLAFKGISFFPERVIEWLGGLIQAGNGAGVALIEATAPGASLALRAEGGNAQAIATAHSTGNGGETRGRAGTSSAKRGAASPDRSPLTRENALFPQFKDKDIPVFMVHDEDKKETHAESKAPSAEALAGAKTGREGAVAVAVAKATVTIKDKNAAEIGKMTEEAKELAGEIKDKLLSKSSGAPPSGNKPSASAKPDEDPSKPQESTEIKDEKPKE